MKKMNDIFTNMTKKAGNVLEQIRRNNKLLESNRKQYNPTFLEIMEELQKDDKTLASMLLFWYMQRHSTNDLEFNKIVNEIETEMSKLGLIQTGDSIIGASCGSSKSKKQKRSYSCGCGFEDLEELASC